MASFKDHFSNHSGRYAAFRPTYPNELLSFLTENSPDKICAWDCATGNGQVAKFLASEFQSIYASDPSGAQLENAQQADNINYQRELAEDCSLPDESVSLITVGQALHWFDHTLFVEQARRVLVEGGVLAIWSYGSARISPEIDSGIFRLAHGTLRPFWPEEALNGGLKNLSDPGGFAKLASPKFSIERAWTALQFSGYVSTWSASQRAKSFYSEEYLQHQIEDFANWEGCKRISWPLMFQAFRRI